MIFCGDFVYPFLEKIDFYELGNEFINSPKLVNIEGLPITTETVRNKKKGIALHSTELVYDIIKDLNIQCCAHANNHSFDYQTDISQIKQHLKLIGVESIGFGINLDDASTPYINHQEKLIVLAFGWHTIGCQYATINTPGINPYIYSWVEKHVIKWRNEFPAYRLVLFPHYNYEMGVYPQPADRSFFHHLIDIGVDAIFGHHPHLIQGYEYFKGKPIFYSLGNFLIPQIEYFDNSLSYPDECLKGICCDYQPDSSINVFLLSQSKAGDKLKIINMGSPESISELVLQSGFAGLNETEYISFFKKNRRHKHKGLPIYYKYDSSLNSFKDRIVLLRQSIIESKWFLKFKS